MDDTYFTFERKPLDTKGATSDGSRPRVSGKQNFVRRNSRAQVTEKGKKTKAPHAFCNGGNAIPIMKLQAHEDKLPMDMATDRGATSNSSERNKEKKTRHQRNVNFLLAFQLNLTI